MKKEHIMDAMDYIDPALVAAADRPAHGRGGKRWVRAALIAACLCLALVGTAVAAQHFGVRIVNGTGGEDDADVWMEGGIAYYPVDSLSEQVAELDDPFYAGKAFDSWEEMEEFIGVDLMNNPVLDASPAANFSHSWTAGSVRVRGRFLAIGSGGLTHILTIGSYEIGEVNITVQGFLFTNRMTEVAEDWDERFYGRSFQDETETGRETYITPGGLETQILTIDRKGNAVDVSCMAAFSLNGIPFYVEADSDNGMEEVRDVLLQVLDGFVVD